MHLCAAAGESYVLRAGFYAGTLLQAVRTVRVVCVLDVCFLEAVSATNLVVWQTIPLLLYLVGI